jgi:hypothetical protein
MGTTATLSELADANLLRVIIADDKPEDWKDLNFDAIQEEWRKDSIELILMDLEELSTEIASRNSRGVADCYFLDIRNDKKETAVNGVNLEQEIRGLRPSARVVFVSSWINHSGEADRSIANLVKNSKAFRLGKDEPMTALIKPCGIKVHPEIRPSEYIWPEIKYYLTELSVLRGFAWDRVHVLPYKTESRSIMPVPVRQIDKLINDVVAYDGSERTKKASMIFVRGGRKWVCIPQISSLIGRICHSLSLATTAGPILGWTSIGVELAKDTPIDLGRGDTSVDSFMGIIKLSASEHMKQLIGMTKSEQICTISQKDQTFTSHDGFPLLTIHFPPNWKEEWKHWTLASEFCGIHDDKSKAV